MILEKLPLFVLALVAGSAAMKAQRQIGAMLTLAMYPISQRIPTIITSYGLYICKMVWYPDLIAFYPLHNEWPWTRYVAVVAATALLAAVSILSAFEYRRRPWLLVGWLWFLGVLLPVSGVFQAGPQAMADRFSYLPCVGLLIMLVWSIPIPATLTLPAIRLRGGLAAAVVAMLCVASWIQSGYWLNDRTLFSRRAGRRSRQLARSRSGQPLPLSRGKSAGGAVAGWFKALKFNPTDPVANYNIGLVLAKQGHDAQAVPHFRRAFCSSRKNTKSMPASERRLCIWAI